MHSSKRHKPLCEKQEVTGEGVAEGGEKTEKEIRKLDMEEPAPSDTKFTEEMTKARKTLKGTGAIKITVRMVTRRIRAIKMGAAPGASGWLEELPHRNDRGSRRRSRMVAATGTRRHRNQRGRSVGARVAGTATWRKDQTRRPDGGFGQVGRRGHD